MPAAAEMVAKEGIDVEVVDCARFTLWTGNYSEIHSQDQQSLIVHEDNLTGGYGAEIAATIAEWGFMDLDAPVKRLAGPDVPGVPFSHPMQDWFMVNPDKIADAIRELAAF